MGANNLYFPSIGRTKDIKSTNYLILDNERTGQPYKIYIDDFVSAIIDEGILVIPNELTINELAAINGASAPSATNLFITQVDLQLVATTGDYNDLLNIPTIANLYNTDGTLTGNRTVTGGGFSLTFDGKIQIKSCFNY
jgi:hypothetical protein